MRASERVITVTPLRELWDENGTIPAIRSRNLSRDDLRALLRHGPLRFVVADIGARPRWLSVESCFAFWKSEVQSHIADPGVPCYLEDYPGDYCYFASEWSPASGTAIVVLETAH